MAYFRCKFGNSEPPIEYMYNWDFTKSLVDEITGYTPTLKAGSNNNPPIRTSEGVIFSEPTQFIDFGDKQFPLRGNTIEYDIGSFDFKGDKSKHIRLLCFSNGLKNSQYNTYRTSPFIWRANTNIGWTMYGWNSDKGNLTSACSWNDIWGTLSGDSDSVIECINGKTVKIVISDDGYTTSIYIDNNLIGTLNGTYWKDNTSKRKQYNNHYMTFGGCDSVSQNAGDQCYDMKLTGLRIYKTPT